MKYDSSTLDGMMEVMERGAKENMAEFGRLDGCCIMTNAEGVTSLFVPFAWSNDEEKAKVLAATRSYLRENKVVCYGIVSECWALDYGNGEVLVRPSQSDRRTEVVAIAAVTSSGQKMFKTFPIVREANEQPRMGEPEIMAETGGELMALFEDGPTDPGAIKVLATVIPGSQH